MKRFPGGGIFGTRLFIATLLCIVIFAVSSAAAAFKNLRVGDQAFPVELRDLEGRDHSLAQYVEARAILVLFWATWSERSLMELEDLRKLNEEYSDNGLQILAVNVEKESLGNEDLQRIRSQLLEREIDFPVLIDDGLHTYSEWGVIATPTTAIIDKNGTIVFDLSSYPTSGFLDMDEAIRKALGLYVKPEIPASAETAYKPEKKSRLHFGLGRRHVEKGFMTKALPEFQKAAEADSRWADPWIYMSYLYLKEGRNTQAAESLQHAQEVEQGREEVLLLRSYLLLLEQKVDEALALLQSNRSGGSETDAGSAPAEPETDAVIQTGAPQVSEGLQANEDGLMDVRTLVEEGRAEEASTHLEEIIASRLTELGFPMQKKKTLSAMEKMKLMMEKKQEQQ